MQVDGAVRLIAVVVERHGDQRDVQAEQRDDHVAETLKFGETVEVLVEEIHVLRILAK